MFLIEERYQHHIDIAEEFYIKKQTYTDYLVDKIGREYGMETVSLFLADYFGYPLNKSDINKNVLNKLKRDLAKKIIGCRLL